ncbi:MAG: L-threonylcarbamoyladenylate synthase [Muribaculaceae bacterium]
MLEENVNDRYVRDVIAAMNGGGIVIVPTDSLYALACDALNNQAIERICRVKMMKSAKENLSIVCSDISMASKYAKIDNEKFKVIRRNLPGAFTFLIEATTKLPKAFKGRKVVGVRITDNKILQAIISELGNPVFCTSVEGDDEDYLCEPELIAQNYERFVDYVIDAGRSDATPSTVVDFTGDEPEVVRQGVSEFVY